MDLPDWRPLQAMPRICGAPLGQATMRQSADDFRVDEVLGFEPDGDGEHVLLHLRKRDTNTNWLAGQLARFAGIPSREVSYAGLKDRHAVTSQWFSLRLAGKPEPDWSALDSERVELLAVHRHRRKLRRGALRGNRFLILLRGVTGDPQDLDQRLQRLRREGMPNYFGEQRFGHDYRNLSRFDELLGDGVRRRIDRHLRGLLISAVRSQLFNEVLAARIERDCWSTPLPGDYFMLDGSRSGFADDPADSRLAERCRSLDIHPSGPLWGRGTPPVSGETAELEQSVLAPFALWRERLEHLGLEQERRALRLRLDDLEWTFEPEAGALRLGFFLPAGAFATVLLRELFEISSPAAV
ncbi:MAG: tRNA pseudouridine(13) synthase TruD [Candidatus Thiodiazotropha sp.]